MATMTSRELEVDPARAQREASAGPVFITEHGRPAFVLMRIEDYRPPAGLAGAGQASARERLDVDPDHDRLS